MTTYTSRNTGERIDDAVDLALDSLDYQPSSQPSLSSNFEKNEHKLVEDYGLVEKQITDLWTTTNGTATRVDHRGLIVPTVANLPRVDWSSGKPRLLNETQRTNLLTWSEDFSNAAWVKSAPYSVVANTHTAPDGSITADSIIVADGIGSLNSSVVRQVISKAASPVQYTRSIFGKLLGATTSIRFVDFGAATSHGASVIVSLIDGSVVTSATALGDFSGASVEVEQYPNGFFKVSLTYTTDSHTSITIRTFPYVDGGQLAGDGSSGLILWGAQIEQASTPSSYIPTEASSVTRVADNVSRTLGSEFNQDEWSFVFDFERSTNTSNALVFKLGPDVTSFNGLGIQSDVAGALGSVRCRVGTTQLISSTFALGIAKRKMALTLKNKLLQFYINGTVSVSLDISSFTDAELADVTTHLYLYAANTMGGAFNRQVKANFSYFNYYPKALSEAECIELTKV